MKRWAPCIVFLAAVVAALGLLAEPAGYPVPSAARPEAPARPAGAAPAISRSTLHCKASVPASNSLVGLAIGTVRLANTLDARRSLEAELLGEGQGALLARRGELERRLRDHPELAPGAARAFAKLGDREEAFVVSRALVGEEQDPEVRSVLLAAAVAPGSSSDVVARRESALLALASAHDPQASPLALAALEDRETVANVRAAGAFALASDAEHAPPGALDAARAVAASPAEDAHLRAEALHLIAAAALPQDRSLADAALADTSAPPELALAAARLALVTGEDRTTVAAALATREDPHGLCAAAAKTLGGAP